MFKKNYLYSAALAATLVSAPQAFAVSMTSSSDILDRYWSPDKLGFLECQYGVLNSTPLGLPRCIQASNIQYHLEMLYGIAQANNGNRAAGLPGYGASLDYIQQTLESVGYQVERKAFPFNMYYELGDGVLEATGPEPSTYVFDQDFTYFSQTTGGDVTAPVTAVDVQLGAGNTSSSGCEADDFAAFPAGHIALLQRGSCAFQTKAENAAAAGASAVIIFNQGDSDDRKDLLDATLGDGYSGGIPALFATYDNGAMWSQISDLELRLKADVVREQTQSYNLVAETARGDGSNIVMAGAHLDSVYAGAGINDNGSGSAALLEMAIQMSKAFPRNKVRFAWWGAEEAGLVGSTEYVKALSDEEKANIKVYLNYDMIGSPNFGNFIYDGDGSSFDLQGPPGSAATEKLFEKYFGLRGLAFEGSEISFRSDYAQFFEEGIAFGGLFTGAEGIKTEEQAVKFGGEAGSAYDPCYHAQCDDLLNINTRALEINADASAFVTSWLSLSTKAIDDEIAASEEQPEGRLSGMSYQHGYDKTHWGKHWIK
ncbi:aminopeptidase [Bacterioplanes sanyensis]|uniref:Aminopeptidase n=1 Tax=Bacterioplanes sanyensis TaxID=1249553 RepID=A0A222FGK8_9GAMM|nr:M28 family metallopeptidase [Bacterioplanes sanyensis]ASP38195.1 aminopeptidase [Bacterioplanes sanyensis]